MSEITPLLIDLYIWLALAAVWLVGVLFVRRTVSRESWGQRMLHVLPLYLGFYLIFGKRNFGPMDYRVYGNGTLAWIGVMLTVAGVAFAIWAHVVIGRYWSGIITLKQDHKLIQSGPYRLVRHPIYTGFLVGVFGTAVSAVRVDGWVGFAIIAISLVYKLRREEKLLTGQFGQGYSEFKEKVPAAILPGVY